jgi:hypothetical protein|tara:strand:- start:237 stop:1259 length:1023 start_codon:yes stop_codon:yes gene_type:complete
MMDRILKRPMFRMGGRSDDGIISVRPKYQEGGDVGFFKGILNAINPTSGEIVKRMQESQNAPSLVETLMKPAPIEFRTEAEASEFLEANPENIAPIKILGSDETINLQPTNDSGESSNVPGTPIVPNVQKKLEAGTGEQSDQELIKSYMDMFSEAMGESEEDVSRQRYLELAKFGANLLGQPGGDLIGSIGRSAAPSIQGLAEGAARRSAGNREIKLAGLKTAIAQMDDPTADKIKTLARLSGVSEKEVAKLMLDTSSDSSLDKIESTAKAIAGDVGASVALKIAQKLEKADLDYEQVKPLPVDKKGKPKESGVPDGYYFDVDGELYKVDKGKPSILKTK